MTKSEEPNEGDSCGGVIHARFDGSETPTASVSAGEPPSTRSHFLGLFSRNVTAIPGRE
jgi:hypothetical protein